MDDQTFIIASILLCSFGGWYVVVTKYLALKKMVKYQNNEIPPHIPGMGPPPVSNIPFTVPEEFLEPEPYSTEPVQQSSAKPAPIPPPQVSNVTSEGQKRQVCNQACMLHLTGFAVISGVPFLNVIIPVLFWLWIKEQHQYLAKQGREVVNFQITFSLLQFACLSGGVLFIRYFPAYAEKLFAFTKIARIVFSTGMYLPFNVFTVLPFFWCCIVMIRGAVAAYHGVSYKYPGAQQFIFATNNSLPPKPPQSKPVPQSAEKPAAVVTGKVSFG